MQIRNAMTDAQGEVRELTADDLQNFRSGVGELPVSLRDMLHAAKPPALNDIGPKGETLDGVTEDMPCAEVAEAVRFELTDESPRR